MTAAPNPRGDALFAELKWVHRMVRADLAKVRAMAADTLAGLAPSRLQARVRSLAANGPLWSLRVNCLHYCRFVHAHHQIESHLLFPAVRAAAPRMGPALDRLDADHLAVADQLREIEEAVDALVRHDEPDSRRRVVDALNALADRLLVHLDYEEEQLEPILRSWDRWPIFG